ncbi:MAG: tail fiber protein [Vicingaceae bacterium]|nr:tail fiber protein [Vicingaceae bacterium]
MNRFKTTDTGGIPIELDDLRYIEGNYIEGFKALLSMYGILATDAIILSGVVRSIVGGNAQYTEGYISFGGEVYHCPAQSLPALGVGESEYLIVDITYDPAGLKVFQNTQSNNTYELRKTKIVNATSLPSGGVAMTFVKRIYDVIREKVDTERSGVVKDFAGAVIPSGYLECDGAAVSRTTYAALFAVIGTTWGVGNGFTTFNLPNLSGKFVVGFDAADSDYNAVAKTGGEKEHVLTEAEMPSHSHKVIKSSGTGGNSEYPSNTAMGNTTPHEATIGTTADTGGDQPHENRPPYTVLKKIIRI